MARPIGFLGLSIDSQKQCTRLAPEKLRSLANLANRLALQPKVTRKDSKVITCHMAFAAKAIYGERTFSRIFIDTLMRLERADHHIRVSKLLRSELTWWRDFAATYNGLCLYEMGRTWPVLEIAPDACFSGSRAVLQHFWLVGIWSRTKEFLSLFLPNRATPPLLAESIAKNINYLELVAACLRLLVPAPLFSDFKICILSDNTQTGSFINRRTTKNLDALAWLKLVFHCSLRHNFRVLAKHSPGVDTVLADALSRITKSPNRSECFLNTFCFNFPESTLPKHFCSSYSQPRTGN